MSAGRGRMVRVGALLLVGAFLFTGAPLPMGTPPLAAAPPSAGTTPFAATASPAAGTPPSAAAPLAPATLLPGEAEEPGAHPGPEAWVEALGDPEEAVRHAAKVSLRNHVRELPAERRAPWLHLLATAEMEGVGPVAARVAGQGVLLAEADPLPRGRSRAEARAEGASVVETFARSPDRAEKEALPLLALASHLVAPSHPEEAHRLRALYGERRGWPTGEEEDPDETRPPADTPARTETAETRTLRTEEAPLLLAHARGILAGAPGGAGEAERRTRSGAPGEGEAVEGVKKAQALLVHLLTLAPQHPLAPEARRLLGTAGTRLREASVTPGLPDSLPQGTPPP